MLGKKQCVFFMEEFMKTNKKDILSILLGNTLLALAVILFIVPGHLLSGGTTGISLFLNQKQTLRRPLNIH